jgi:hypothetical protein
MYPVCERCQKNSKVCYYQYPPQLLRDDTVNAVPSTAVWPGTGAVSPDAVSNSSQLMSTNDGYNMQVQLERCNTLQLEELRHLIIPRMLGNLGELPPILETVSCVWVTYQIQDYPLAFAKQAETVFINKNLYRQSFPRALRAAFGICAGCVSINERNQPILFQALDGEMSELLTPGLTSTLVEDLVKLQAAVLYQIIRLFYGDLEQRIVAERQEYLVRSYGLTLLQRADEELRSRQRTWEQWILAESIRRTVLIAFKLYTIYSYSRHGVCTESTAISILPVSTKPGSWNSRAAYLQYPDQDETMTYSDFTSSWNPYPQKKLEPFEKLLLAGCMGIEQFEAVISCPNFME